MADKQKPGVMIYFDLRPCLQRLTNEQKGALFSAILDYAENGVLPELDNVAVGVAWDFVKPRIDRDAETYASKVEKARAAINKRWAAPTNTDVYGGIRENTDVYERIPTTTTTSTSTPTTASNGGMPLDAAPPTTSKPKATRFVPPTLDEVREFVQSRNSPVDPQGFIDFYESKGWVVGKSPMPPFDILPLFSAGRSRKLTLVPIIQSLAQLEKNYGKEGAEIVCDNCRATRF